MRSIRLEKCKNVEQEGRCCYRSDICCVEEQFDAAIVQTSVVLRNNLKLLCKFDVALFVKDKSQASLSPQLPLSRLSSVHFLSSEKFTVAVLRGSHPFSCIDFLLCHDSFLGKKNSTAEHLTTWHGFWTAPWLDDAVESSKVRRRDTHAEQTRRKIWCSGGQARGRKICIYRVWHTMNQKDWQ